MDLNLFRIFDAIYRAGSLTEAAADLHLTQPAVSNALARLREHFDDPLFERRGRGIAPTPLANSIAGDIAGALLSLHSSVQRSQQFDPATSTRQFVLSMPDPLEFVTLPALVQLLQDRAPGIRLLSRRLAREQLSRHLASGEVSIAVDVPLRVDSSISSQGLFSDKLCVAMRQGHKLAASELSVDAYLQAKHISVSRRSSGQVFEDQELSRRGLEREVMLRGQNYPSACHIVAETDLILTLPRYLALRFQQLLPLHLAELPLPLPALSLMMYWHSGANKDAAHTWLRQQLREKADSVGADIHADASLARK